jgi:hypothetical protein
MQCSIGEERILIFKHLVLISLYYIYSLSVCTIFFVTPFLFHILEDGYMRKEGNMKWTACEKHPCTK